MDKIGQAYEMLLTGAALILAVLILVAMRLMKKMDVQDN